MRKRSFGKVLDGIVSVVLASAVGAVGAGAYGCGGTAGVAELREGGLPTGDGGTGDGGFADEDSFGCAGPLTEIVSNLKPGKPVDYVELRRQSFDSSNPQPQGDGGDTDGGSADAGAAPLVVKTISTNGQACATASDRDACLATLAIASIGSQTEGWIANRRVGNEPTPPTVDYDFLVYTRGDEVGIVGSPAQVATFLGDIDTLEEARLMLVIEGHGFACSENPKTGWRQNADGSWELIVAGNACSSNRRLRLRVGANGKVTQIDAEPYANPVACGRRPEGLSEDRAAGGGFAAGLGPYFADVAHLEAASVVAFRRLELELLRFGAPAALVKRARRARADEIRHARETAALARRFGGEVRALEVAPMGERDLLAIAIENATEGCVRETYGALVAAFQARTAADPEVRDVLSRIARDEARHAELSHDIAIWLDARLDARSRALVAEERARALDQLRVAIEVAPAADVVDRAGMPTAHEARALLDGLERDVLAA